MEGFDIAEISEFLRQEGVTIWLDLHDPDPADLAVLTEELGLHPLAVEDAVQRHERPKLDRYPDHLFLSAYAVRLDEATAELVSSELAAFITPQALITVRKDMLRRRRPGQAVGGQAPTWSCTASATCSTGCSTTSWTATSPRLNQAGTDGLRTDQRPDDAWTDALVGGKGDCCFFEYPVDNRHVADKADGGSGCCRVSGREWHRNCRYRRSLLSDADVGSARRCMEVY